MNLQEIKQALASGQKVYWANASYEVIEHKDREYYIYREIGDYCIGLTRQDGTTLNGKESDFFIGGIK